MSRKADLLRKAAEAFEGGRVPDHAFLVENSVTLDECGDLLDSIAIAIRVYLRMDKDDRLALAVESAGDRDPAMAEIAGFVANGLRMRAITRKIKSA